MKKKLLSGKKLTNALDQVIRDIFKVKYGDNPTCFVTGHKDGWFSWKERPYGIQVGHYVSRKRTILRWDLKNVFPQSSSSNKTHNQDPTPFTLAILKKYGQKRLDYFKERIDYSKEHKMTTGEKRQLLLDLKEHLKELQSSKS